MPVKKRKDVEPVLEEKPAPRRKPKRVVHMPPDLAERQKAGRPIQITLQFEHSINSKRYGPGVVSVKRDVASVLQEQERNVRAMMEAEANPKACIIDPYTRSITRVPPQMFDAYFNSMYGV